MILTALALLLFTEMGAKAQHEGHQMPAQTVKKKAKPSKKKTTARSSARKGKTTSRSSQTGKAVPQPTKTKDTQQHTSMDHATMDHSTMDMRQPGSTGMSTMNEQSRHALVVTYAHSIGRFAKTLRDRVQSTQTVDAGFALRIVDEIKRSLDAIEQQHGEHGASMSANTQSKISAMMKEIRVSALRQSLTALERDLHAEAPATSVVLQRADEIIRLSGVPPGTQHQHGTGTKPEDERSITKLEQKDDMSQQQRKE